MSHLSSLILLLLNFGREKVQSAIYPVLGDGRVLIKQRHYNIWDVRLADRSMINDFSHCDNIWLCEEW